MHISRIDQDYIKLIEQLKGKIQAAQTRAALAVNHELIKVYWEIGKSIVEQQASKKWGEKFLEQLSIDLRNAFPDMFGFSASNLKKMRMFAQHYPNFEIGSQVVTQLPWGHILVLIYHIKDLKIRDWYAKKCLELGWSRSSLESHIESKLFERQGINSLKTSNYLQKLPAPQSELALDLLKTPLNLKFTGLYDDAHERDIELQTLNHISKFLLELGKGFAFVGRQFPIEVGGKEFFIDLLFYHLKLRAYVVVEIKATEFKPEHAGQLNFYLTAIDRDIKHPDDQASIGILLCKSHNQTVAEYALSDINKPIGVSNYELTKALPDNLKSSLPSIEEFEYELAQLENKKE